MLTAASSAVDGRPSRSSSAIVVGTVSGHHVLKIDGYSRTKELLPPGTYTESCDFRVGSYTWHINYYPNGSSSSDCISLSPNGRSPTDYISLCLVLDLDESIFFLKRNLNESIVQHEKAQVQFSLLDQAGEPVPAYSRAITADLSNQSCWTCSNLIKRADLERSVVLLKDDSFTVRCDITLMKPPRATTPAVVDTVAPPSDLYLHLGALLLGEEGADVTFQVGGESFAAHRCVLAARSSVFKAELLGAMRESTAKSIVHVDGMEAQVFKALLHFIYTDALPEFSEQQETWMAQHLLVAADRYNMERLRLICEDKLCERIDVNSAATTLALAEQHHCRRLKEACLRFLDFPADLKAVEATDGFEHLARSCPALLRELIAKLGVF